MDENKFAQLIKNDEFIDGLLGCSSREEMRQIFENYGQTVSEEELDYFVETVEKALQTANSICSDESMEIVAGGQKIDGGDVEAEQHFDPIEDAFCRKAIFNAHNESFKPM
ncbi:MAG: hypothetical protein Q4D57_01185 [Clostridia bacterium]|nr:hypothetical protein [Clostridia bacterium]